MTIFTAVFSAVAVSAAQDVFSIVAPTRSRVRIREIRLGQYSDFGDSQAEILAVALVRGNTVAGTGGAAVTPSNIHSWSRAAASTVRRNDTTGASGGTAVTLIADVMNVAAGWWYRPDEEEMPWLEALERAVLTLSAPADALTMNGTLVLEEMGLVAP